MDGDNYADIYRAMNDAPHLARGFSQLIKPANPAAGAGFTRGVPNDTWERYVSLAFTLTTGAAAGFRQALVNLLDGDGFIFAQVPATPQIPASSAITAFLSDTTVAIPALEPSLHNEGSVTGPAAGAAITSIAAVPAGKYQVTGTIELTGTMTAAELNNFELLNGAAVAQVLLIPNVANTLANFGPIEIDAPGGASVSVNAIALAGAAAVYAANLTVTLDAPAVFYGQMPHVTMRSGWQAQIAVTGIQAADQLSAIGLFAQRLPSDYATGTIADERRHAERELLEYLGHTG